MLPQPRPSAAMTIIHGARITRSPGALRIRVMTATRGARTPAAAASASSAVASTSAIVTADLASVAGLYYTEIQQAMAVYKY